MNIPPLDPLVIDYAENEWQLGEVTGKFALREVKTYGMAKTNFLAVRPRRSADRLNMEVDLEIPRVFIEGEYKGEGSVGPYKVAGKGEFILDRFIKILFLKEWSKVLSGLNMKAE